MVLPCSGLIWASDINNELGRPWNNWFDINDGGIRNLAGKPSGQIWFSDFHCKANEVREPASGEIFSISNPVSYFSTEGAGWVNVYWYGSKNYGGRPGAQTTVVSSGTWTYYRGNLGYSTTGQYYYGVWRIGRY